MDDEWPPATLVEVEKFGVTPERVQRLFAGRRAKQPKAFRAIFEDAKMFSLVRAEAFDDKSVVKMMWSAIRLSWVTDAFLALALYRIRMRLTYFRIPVLPTLLHKLSMNLAQVCIGEPVVIEPGIYVPHGQIVIDGLVEIGSHAIIAPWVGIGNEIGNVLGAKIGRGVYMGTGVRIIGPVRIGSHSQLAASAVVIHDVPERTVVAGSPARVVGVARPSVNFPPLNS